MAPFWASREWDRDHNVPISVMFLRTFGPLRKSYFLEIDNIIIFLCYVFFETGSCMAYLCSFIPRHSNTSDVCRVFPF